MVRLRAMMYTQSNVMNYAHTTGTLFIATESAGGMPLRFNMSSLWDLSVTMVLPGQQYRSIAF